MSLNKDDDFPASLMDPAKPAAAPPGAGAGAGVAVSALSLVLTTAGAGVLAFPYAAAQTGVLPLLSLLAALAALSAWCGLINAEAAWRAQRAAPLRARTFDELAGRTLARARLRCGGYGVASAQVLAGLAGTLVGFLCVAGDLGTPALGGVLGGRAGVIAAFAAVVVLPLAGCARIHALRGASALGVAAVAAVVALLAARGVTTAMAAAPPPPPALFVPSLRGLWLAIPVVMYALGNQVVGVNIFFDAAPEVQRQWHWPVAAAYAAIVSLYVVAALGGAFAFGADAKGDVLLNFALDDTAANAIKVVMAIHVSLVLPVDIVPLRRSLAQALRRCARRMRKQVPAAPQPAAIDARALLAAGDDDAEKSGADDSGRLPLASQAATGDGGSTGDDEDDAAADVHEAALPRICGMPCSPAIAAQTVALVATAASAAIFLPQLSVVFGLLGATLGVTCLSGYPGLFLLAKADAIDAAGGRLDDDEPGAPIYSPASPRTLRVLGWATLILSALMAVLGTAVCVYSTWIMTGS